jgi:hypothetical protein
MPNGEEFHRLTDREILVLTAERVKTLDERFISVETTQLEHAKQIAFWRGSLALVAFLLLTFGTFLVAHVLGGK